MCFVVLVDVVMSAPLPLRPGVSLTLCRVTGLTLSKEQLAEATARVSAAGLSDRVTLLFCDYR